MFAGVKALLCTRFGGPDVLEMTELPDPVAGEGQVLIDVKVCAVNFTDYLVIQNRYQYKPPLPFIPGGEVAGVVRAVGAGVTTVAVGERVIASTQIGGLAEQVVARASAVTVIPEGVDLAEASGLLYAHGTSYHALADRAHLQAGESLVVLGAAGGVGLAAVELGRLMGARVIAAASTEEKLEVCRRHGAHETINYEKEDLKTRIRDLTDGVGADVVYDPVGGPYAEPALRSTAWDGRFLVVGFAAGDIPRIPLNLPLLRGCSVIGVFLGSFTQRFPDRSRRNAEQLGAWWREGRLTPFVSATYPLARGADAIADLGERRATGRVVVTVE
jgi:NADPH2:quinone reductase